MIEIYTDGSCLTNPGNGGWAAIINKDGDITKISGSEKNTTNNRMELLATINALRDLDANSQIKIYTDSVYLKEGITVWLANWEKNNWKTADKKNVKNVDLWKKLKELVKSKQIEWLWVKGHSGDPMNDLADKLAKEATPI